MKYLYQILAVWGVIYSPPLSAMGPTIDLLSSGQGNCILVRYNDQAMLIDAGSSEMHFPAAYEKKILKEPIPFKLEEPQELPLSSLVLGASSSSPLSSLSTHRPTFSTHHGDSTENSSTDSHPTEAAKRAREETTAPKKSIKDIAREDFKKNLLTSIHDSLPRDVNTNSLRLKTLLITHPDEDHYNLIPEIFSLRQNFFIEDIILGGFYADYSPSFQTWLDRNQPMIGRVLFTGMADGGRGPASALLEEGLARAYYSGLVPQTSLEEKIENALSFKGEAQEPGFPRFEILSMNAGHATELDGRVRRANERKNVNSIVLRLATPTQSIILSGDAEMATWRHIASHTWAIGKNLTTDYLVVSHHGSKEDGATHPEVLYQIQPKACFVSAGRHLKYHHPHQDTMNLLMSLKSLHRANYHDVSYFGPDKQNSRKFVYRRRSTSIAIFSTLNSGTLSLILGEKTRTVRASQSKPRIYKTVDSDPKKFGVNYEGVYCLEEGKTMEVALADLTRQLEEAQTNLTLWQPTLADKNKIEFRERPFQGIEYETEFHVLVKEEKGRFYFLEELEE